MCWPPRWTVVRCDESARDYGKKKNASTNPRVSQISRSVWLPACDVVIDLTSSMWVVGPVPPQLKTAYSRVRTLNLTDAPASDHPAPAEGGGPNFGGTARAALG